VPRFAKLALTSRRVGGQNHSPYVTQKPIRLTPFGRLLIAMRATDPLQDLLYFVRDPWPWGKPHEAAGIHRTSARPGGNTTGFTIFEYGLSPKWLALLKEIAPGVTRAAVLRDPTVASLIGLLGGIQSVAPSLRMELSLIDSREAGEIERALAAFAREPNGGLIMFTSAMAFRHRELIFTLAARHRLPAVYIDRAFVTAGGLTSYGPDRIEQYRQAAGYVDRILKGEKPANLPVQTPTKYELVINLKTARALGIEVPPTLLARADEVIE